MGLVSDVIDWFSPGEFDVQQAIEERRVRTQLSATVFTGDARKWIDYLSQTPNERYKKKTRVRIQWEPASKTLRFDPLDENAEPLTELLNKTHRDVCKRLAKRPMLLESLHEAIFENESNGEKPLELRLSSKIPSHVTREMGRSTTSIVCNAEEVAKIQSRVADCESKDECLGYTLALHGRILSRLAYNNHPRDRFFEKIRVVAQSLPLLTPLLYEGMSYGRLVPTKAGKVNEMLISKQTGIPQKHLIHDHPYFRMLNRLGSMLFDYKLFKEHEDIVELVAREYVDEKYLRLGISGIMPDVTDTMRAMKYKRKKDRILTDSPEIGRYGILNKSDKKAWNRIAKPMKSMGYTLLSQLGSGEFGRVYDALNQANPSLPLRVAIKVDRSVKQDEAKSIRDSASMIRIGQDLARSPHIIRLFDAGQIPGMGNNYHILQRVDGDTLDNLIGVTGREHSSFMNKPRPGRDEKSRREDYEQRIKESHGEGWRRERITLPFIAQPNLLQYAELLTSILLWVEKVHELGYAVNDLKNCNIMVSRRGQLKAIDLDSYGTIHEPLDKISDFLFLSSSLLLGSMRHRNRTMSALEVEKLLRSPDALREVLSSEELHDESGISQFGRLAHQEFVDFEVDLLHRCRGRRYIDDPSALSADIDRLIRIKRDMSTDELVLD
ncbi:MAG: hypothetical protein ACF8CQ_02105 [Rhodopirellula sp. JB044]|uniref:hypothetical protein n=1 Tax=Rhodopirellula sp. JB044 TaxID=3342844 RepID=UPI00370CCFB3